VTSAREARSAAEKKSLHAIERDTEENRRKREAYLQAIATVAP
jgi:hypothetical protein